MKFWADENFNGDALAELLRLHPELDIVRVQDTQFGGSSDPVLLALAAEQGVILLTHDIRTIPKYAIERVRAGLRMPGVIEVPQVMSVGTIVAELEIVFEASVPEDFENRVYYI